MPKPTLKSLTERLDSASAMCARMHDRIKALEEQDTKTRKQLWYLQKIAKGEFKVQAPPKQVTETQQQAHDEAHEGCF